MYKYIHGCEQLEIIPRIIRRSHNTNPTSVPEPRKRKREGVEIIPRSHNTTLAAIPEPQTLTVENRPHDNAPLQTLLRHCSNCKGLSHNKLQCPSLPCNFCKELGHVSAGCPIRQGINKVNYRKSKAKSRAKRSLINRRRKHLERWLGARESPSKGEASASQVLLRAAEQPVRIEEVDVGMTKDQLHDLENFTSYAEGGRYGGRSVR